MRNKFLVLGAALVAAAPAALAQDTNLSSYQGPGILSHGIGDIGSRGGEQVDLRYYLGVSGSLDTNLAPFLTDSKGNLLRIHNLYGIEFSGGLYGVHSWKTSQLGLDYKGAYRKYVNVDSYSGSDHSLTLGYTHQSSRRLAFDLRESAGTVSLGTSQIADAVTSDPNAPFTSTGFFDNRTNFLQSTAFATWNQSARMSYSFGGSAYLQDRKSFGLSNSWGFDLTGTALRRVSKSTTVGASFTRSHLEFPEFFSHSDSNSYHGVFAAVFGRFWTLNVEAGVTVSEVASPFSVSLTPALAALFGQSTISGIVSSRNIFPSGSASLKRRFHHASADFSYIKGVNSGNGAYSTTRIENARAGLSYSGIRRLNAGVDGSYFGGSAIGQALGSYREFSAAAGFTYNLGHAMHLSARFDLRNQQIDLVRYRRTASRTTIGLMFSPGSLPLALW